MISASAFRNEYAGVVANWPGPANVRALSTTRSMPGNSMPPYDAFNLGLRCGDDAGAVQANRDLLVRAFELPSPPRWLRQVHGCRSFRLTSECFDDEPEADAAFTTTRAVVLAILTADCLPVLMCADDGSEIAAAHAGWRGLAGGVIEGCVNRLATSPVNLLVWLGPAIAAASYEVGEEVRAAFLAHDANAQAAFTPTRPGHWHCDLYTLARQRLHALGVNRIYGGELDTVTDARLYSFRRDANQSGRMASLIWLQP